MPIRVLLELQGYFVIETAPRCRVRERSELWAQELGKTLDMRVMFLSCLGVTLITFLKNGIYCWLLVFCVVLGYPRDMQ